MRREEHPTVRRLREAGREGATNGGKGPLRAEELRELARACGADDVGVVEIGHAELDPQRSLANVHRLTLPGAGHFSPLERPNDEAPILRGRDELSRP